MRFVSWNVNGLRACVQKGFLDFFHSTNADFFCLQETKLQEGQIALDLPGYEQYWCYAEKKGYSGTAIFTKHTPQSVQYGIGVAELDTEGRVITLEYPEFYLVTCYTPNAQRGLARIEHRLQWEAAFRNYLAELDSKKSVVLCGDLNVAHKEIDLKNPSSNRGNAGFSDEERNAFTELLESGFTDTFRHLNPTATGCYTWWSYMFNARQNNAGWRIDYFLVSDRLQDAIYRTPIHNNVMGSDHCPVELDLDIRCNGGIWSSSEDPEAVILEEHTKKTGKSSGVKAAALLSAALILLIGILVFRSPAAKPELPSGESTAAPPASPTYPDTGNVFTCITAQTELTNVYDMSSFSSQLYLNGFAEGQTFWKTQRIPLSEQGHPACGFNYWVRVIPALPDDMKDCKVSVQITDATSADSSHPISVLSVRYYDLNDQFAGWFVFGYIPSNTSILISLQDENGTNLQNMVLNLSPILTETDAMQMSTDELLDFALHWRGFIPPTTSSSITQMTPEVYKSYWSTQPALKVLTYRADFHEQLGKRISGNYVTGIQNIMLKQMDTFLQGTYERYGTYPSWEEATAMSTDALVRYLSHHDGFLRYMTQHLISSTFPASSGASYQEAKLFNPILEILENREDALDVLLQYMDSSYIVKLLLDQPEYLKNATASQAERYLNTVYDGDWRSVISTEDLLSFVMNLARVWLSVNTSAPYELLVQSFSCVKELENREDTVDILLSYLTEITFGGTGNRRIFATFLLKQSVYYNRMTEAQKQIYETHKHDIIYGNESLIVGPVAPQPRIPTDLYIGTVLPVISG